MDGPKRRKEELIVAMNFEPSRLEEQNLGAAYELILPISERVSRVQKGQERRSDMRRERQLDIFSLAASQ